MKKLVKFIVAFAIMLIALPLGGNIVKADDKTVDLEEGEYTINFKFVGSSASYMKEFTTGNADLTVDKNGNQYIEITFSGANMIPKIKILRDTYSGGMFNPEDVENQDGRDADRFGEDLDNNTVVFGFPVNVIELEEQVHGAIVVNTGKNIMTHGVELEFDIESIEPVEDNGEEPKEDPKEEPAENRIKLNHPTPVKKGEIVKVEGEKGFQLKMPEDKDFPNGVELTINPVKKGDVKTNGNIEIAGQVYEFNFDGIGSYKGKFILTMDYEADKYSSVKVDIYYFDENKKEWIAQGGIAKDGKVTVEVDHFSTYGVFADVSETSLLKPDNAYEIDYTILHSDGSKVSSADEFFEKPAYLFEKDGKKYFQLTITNGDMVRSLSNKYGKALIVGEESDGTITVQLRADDDLSDMTLSMFISVPGLYDMQHDAILVFDKHSKKEIKVADHMLIGTSNSNNGNGIYVEGESSNELGDDKEEKTEETSTTETDETLNPKTGDSNNIALYVLLLIGSLIPLGFLIKKRRFN